VDAFAGPLVNSARTREVAEQLLGSSSSMASNYRAAGRARSHAEFTAKIGVVLEEADESQHWLQHLDACRLADADHIAPLLAEATELVAIFTSSAKTARQAEDERRRRGPGRRRRKRDDK
jgi:four helix bundle protein